MTEDMTRKMKKIAIIASIVVGVIIVGAVIFGVLNALVGKGTWSTGWNDYRYDERGFSVGDATLPADTLTEIDVDWIDGAVLIVPCQDAYPSLTEKTADGAELPDSARLRWRVSEDGSKLTVKYRKSSWFFGFGNQNRNKTLILRIPERMLPQIKLMDVECVSGNIVLDNLQVAALDLENMSGNIRIRNCAVGRLSIESVSGDVEAACEVRERLEIEIVSGDVLFESATCPPSLEIDSTDGDVTVQLPTQADFRLTWETVSGRISSDFSHQVNGNIYTVGNGSATFDVETVSGDLTLSKP